MTDPILRTCNKCGEVKPLDQFPPAPKYRQGRRPQCRDCTREYQREYQRRWWQANPERARENSRETTRRWNKANPERAREATRRYRQANPERVLRWPGRTPEAVREGSRRHREAVRVKVFGHYGESCACCGTTDRLSIDHVNGDGGTHRKQVGRGTQFYQWLVNNGFPEGFQVLCLPCNKSKDTGDACRIDHTAKAVAS